MARNHVIKGKYRNLTRGTFSHELHTRELEDEFVELCKSNANDSQLRAWCNAKRIDPFIIPRRFKYTRQKYKCPASWGGPRGNGYTKLRRQASR